MTRSSALVIHPDVRFVADLRGALKPAGYEVRHAPTAQAGMLRARTKTPEAIIVGPELPGVGAVAVCRAVRELNQQASIVMLTSPAAVQARIEGLEAGADDCLEIPYDARELLARLRGTIRRRRELGRCRDHGTGQVLRFAELELDPDAHAARIEGCAIGLTRMEYRLLELFMINRGLVLPSQLIYDQVWSVGSGQGNTLRVRIGHLRSKLEAAQGRRLIQTVRGVGYVLREP